MTDAPDTRAVSIITDHPFRPRTEPIYYPRRVEGRWSPAWDRAHPPNLYLCAHCRLAEAAHLDTTVTREEKR